MSVDELKECPKCGAPVEESKVTSKRNWNGKPITIKNVPVMVCTDKNCKEHYYKGSVVDRIEGFKKLVVQGYIMESVFEYDAI